MFRKVLKSLKRSCFKRLYSVLGLLSLLLVFAPTALAAPTWLAPEGLSVSGKSGQKPQLAVSERGEVTAVWTSFDGSNYVVEAATRLPGKTWSTAQTLSQPSTSAGDVQVVLAADTSAVAIWRRFDGARDVVQAATRTAQGTWSTPRDISDSSQDAKQPQLTAGPAGAVTALWSRIKSSVLVVQTAQLDQGGQWSAPVDVSRVDRNAEQPQLATGSDGTTVAVWRQEDGSNTIIHAAHRSSSSWSEPIAISKAGQSAQRPQVAVDSSGQAEAVWYRHNGTYHVVQAASSSGSGQWGEPVDLSSPQQSPGDADQPQIAVDPKGAFTAVWRMHLTSGPYLIEAAARPVSGSWQADGQIAKGSQPQVAIGPDGTAIAVSYRPEGEFAVVQATSRPPGGSWATSSNSLSALDGVALEPQVGFDSYGNAAAVWRNQSLGDVIQAAGYDAAGPQLDAVSIPASGTVSAPIAFSVTPTDVWSQVGEVSWVFGDGQDGRGAAVSHSYGAVGSYSVSVRAVDALGNSSSASTKTLSIDAAQAQAPSPTPTPGPSTGPANDSSAPRAAVGQRAPTLRRCRVRSRRVSLPRLWRARAKFQWFVRCSMRQPARLSIAVRRRSGKRVTRFSVQGAKGLNKVVLPARVIKKLGKRKSYTFEIVAVDATGSSSPKRRVTFKLRA